jgi:hypothetical protein
MNYLFAIGITTYQYDFNILPNAVQDVKKIIDILTKKYSFELIGRPLFDSDATRENILEKLTLLASNIYKEDNLIIFYAGHGEMNPQSKKGFWVPNDAKRKVSDFIPNSQIKDIIETIEAKHIFLITDSCFSGTFLMQERSMMANYSYKKLAQTKSRWVLASGRDEKVSDGVAGETSPFAKYLIKILDENQREYLSVMDIINYVSIATGSNAKQLPIGSHIENVGHEGGQLVLILNKNFVSKFEEKFDNAENKLQETNSRDYDNMFDNDVPGINFSFKEEFHLLENKEELSIFFQNAALRYKQNLIPLCNVILKEEEEILFNIKILQEDLQELSSKKKIVIWKEILFGFSKIKEELLYKIEALVITKISMGYGYMGYEMCVNSFFELLKDLWQVRLIMDETNVEQELKTRFIHLKPERYKGDVKLWIKCNDDFGFSIYESDSFVEEIFSKYIKLNLGDNSKSYKFSSVFGIEVSDIPFDLIVTKVIPSFVDASYHEKILLSEIKNWRVQDKSVLIS